MTKEKSFKLSESTNMTLDIKTIVMVIGFTVSLVSVYFVVYITSRNSSIKRIT